MSVVNGTTTLALWIAAAATADDNTTTGGDANEIAISDDGDSVRDESPWIRRWRPERNLGEVGAYGGVFFPSTRHELYAVDAMGGEGMEPLQTAAGMVGGRLGYYPLRHLGAEVEAGAMPTRTVDNDRATLWHARGSVVGQLGLWSVTPFVLAGAGALGVRSSAAAEGNDTDAAFHFGGGVKVFASRYSQVRVDVRDVVAARRGVDRSVSHNAEVMLGATLVLGRAKEKAPANDGPRDYDRDGFLDDVDKCPKVPGIAPDGCPDPDRDGDGIRNATDECPEVPGVAPHGCPPSDRDRDGFLDADDACPDEPGVEPDGCPLRDTDRDGILDPEDKCVDDPETRNGFEDADGCPDELPEAVKAFNGVLEGIHFELDSANIRAISRPVLQRAAKTLREYPEIRITIVGHTDSSGGFAHNMDLSKRRAASVRDWLVESGVAADRFEIRGAGPNEPIADNATKDGKQKNRRIEFQIIAE